MDGTDVNGGGPKGALGLHDSPLTDLYWAASSGRQHGELDSTRQLPVWTWWDVNVKWSFGPVKKKKITTSTAEAAEAQNTKIRYLQYFGHSNAHWKNTHFVLNCFIFPLNINPWWQRTFTMVQNKSQISQIEKKNGPTYLHVLFSAYPFDFKQAGGCLISKKKGY